MGRERDKVKGVGFLVAFSRRFKSLVNLPSLRGFFFQRREKLALKMPGAQLTTEAKDAFIIFDENYEGNDVDALYLGDILRALSVNITNAKCVEKGMSDALGVKRITFDEFLPILDECLADASSAGVKEDYVEGLKVFDKESTGKVPLAEICNCLCSLGEKLDNAQADQLMKLLGMVEDEEGFVEYMVFIEKLLAACA